MRTRTARLRLFKVHGGVLFVVGVMLLVAPVVVAESFHVSVGAPSDDAANVPELYAGLALLRMIGVFAVTLSAVLLVGARALADAGSSVLGALFTASAVGTLWAFMQQTAIWGSATGWVVVAALAALTLAYGVSWWRLASRDPSLEPSEQ
ncbi:hypothetical protein ER308_00905 [Egibacter rhizosphaerae]|uniref:Uncharacterized protein n=1 Tax=Egibacter rhizosphaerae TaxID=1670831 RepID=A0A411YAR6_9ACTN|nr:hypothetical protein [Egibacter rhizosphaerae]QBI18269.1 hypothetical protein ER308_00905 [Egibacter rhizosphaerae]